MAQYPRFIRQDWGDREIARHFLSAGTPYPSPDYPGPTDPTSPYGIYVNKKEKTVRIVDAVTGQPLSIPKSKYITFYYMHRDPTFHIVQDDASIAKWGEREIIMVSPDRQFDGLFLALAEAEVRDKAQSALNFECEVYDDIYQIGDTVHFVAPELGLDAELMVYEIVRDFDAKVRANFPGRDPGQSVKIKAGAKISQDLRHILRFLNQKIGALNRAHSMTDLDVESGFLAPVQWKRIYPEVLEIKENVEFTLTVIANRINTGRLNNSRINVI